MLPDRWRRGREGAMTQPGWTRQQWGSGTRNLPSPRLKKRGNKKPCDEVFNGKATCAQEGPEVAMKNMRTEAVWKALDNLRIELPSWGFANTGTRFGKFLQPAAASTIEEKFSDAAQVHAVTGACPTMALHVQWDLPNGLQDAGKVKELAEKHGIKPGSINPNVFQDQEYKYGSVGNPDASIRRKALNHILDCVLIAEALGCRDISPWFADASNYPGTQNIRKRIDYFEEGL